MKKKTISKLCFSLLLSLLIMLVFAGTLLSALSFAITCIVKPTNIVTWERSSSIVVTVLSLLLFCFSFRQMTKSISSVSVGKKPVPICELIVLTLSGYGFTSIFAYLGMSLNTGIVYLITGKLKTLKDTAIVANAFDEVPIVLLITYVVILGPLLEELIFRKLLIDKLRPFGYTVSIVTSGIMFGAYHMNLEQFFYAAFLGIILGSIYYKTGNFLYTFISHAAFNFTTVFLSFILADYIQLAGVLSLLLNIIGILCFILWGRKLLFKKPDETIFHLSFKDIWLNPGMIIFLVFTLGASILTLFPIH